MKTLRIRLLILLLCTFLYSCSKNEIENDKVNNTRQNTIFFNLNVGNEWVYKKYDNTSQNPNQFAFYGFVDSVKIIGVQTIQGLTFAKKRSRTRNIITNAYYNEEISYVRINSFGHLIEVLAIPPDEYPFTETTGWVLHPGFDQDFIFNRVLDQGEQIHSLYQPTNLTVEGNSYFVYPYKGVFTPSASYPDLVSKTVEYNYEQNIGLVKRVCHAVYGNYQWEDRLVSYQIN